MPVYSMTGYASVQCSTSPALASSPSTSARLGLEIRAINSRFLDLAFRLPEEIRHLEPSFRDALTQRLRRGKIEVRAHINADHNASIQAPSPEWLQRLADVQSNVQAGLPNARGLSVADVLRMGAGQNEVASADDSTWLQLAHQGIDALQTARANEGHRLATMLRGHVAQLHALSAQAKPLVPLLVEQQRQRFLQRWQDAMQLGEGHVLPEAAHDRAMSEATAYAIRIDVAEELTRLQSHLQEIEALLGREGDLGKRLDFLIQELHREANTLGSKSATLEMTRISVDMKVLIEQMREQVQNIE